MGCAASVPAVAADPDDRVSSGQRCCTTGRGMQVCSTAFRSLESALRALRCTHIPGSRGCLSAASHVLEMMSASLQMIRGEKSIQGAIAAGALAPCAEVQASPAAVRPVS